MHGSRSKIPSKKSRPYIYDVKFLALLGAPYIHGISRLRVKNGHLLKRKQMTSTAWVESINARKAGGWGGGRGRTYRSCRNHESATLQGLIPLVAIYYKPNLCIALTTQNTIEKKLYYSHAQNTTALNPAVFLTEYVRDCSQRRDGRLTPTQITGNVNCKFLIQN
jgi:hypothetical protein